MELKIEFVNSRLSMSLYFNHNFRLKYQIAVAIRVRVWLKYQIAVAIRVRVSKHKYKTV